MSEQSIVPGRFAIPLRTGDYYDSLEHTVCAEKELNIRCLLAGQEEQAIHRRLFAKGKFQISLIPSFECNLRCPQCYVGHLLAKPSGDQIGGTDPKRLISFIRRAEGHLGPFVELSIVGGEPFLHPDAFRAYLDEGLPISTTTNGVFRFESVQDIIGRLNHITFSIDGWPEQHNRTRKSLDPDVNPFAVTYRNLCRTLESFPHLDVTVQGAIIDDAVRNPENSLRYFMLMVAAGVKRRNISLGPCSATLRRRATESYLETIACSTRRTPCCDHLLHKGLCVYNNMIYGSYYTFEEAPAIGHLDDPIDEILSAKRSSILRSMPMLKDEVCMRECKAVGICWGMCTSDRHVFADSKPSSVCDRGFKEREVYDGAMRCGSSNS